MANDFTSRYLQRRRELMGGGTSKATNNARKAGNATVKTADTGKGGTDQKDDFTSQYLARRKELLSGGTTGLERPAVPNPAEAAPSVASALRRSLPVQPSGRPILRQSAEEKTDSAKEETKEQGKSEDTQTDSEGTNWGRVALGTVLKGADLFATGLTSTAAWLEGAFLKPAGLLLGDDEFYTRGPLYLLNEKMQGDAQTNREVFAEDFKSAGKVGEFLDNFGTATVAAVPQAVLAFMTAGASLGAQGTTAGLQAASSATGSGLAQSVATGVQNMAKNPQYWLSFLQGAGNDYEAAKADGANELQATSYAMLTNLVNAAVEVGGGIDTLPQNLQDAERGGKSALRQWVESMIDEGKEEVVQGAVSQLYQTVYGKNNPLFSLTDESAVISPARAAEEFAGGALVGGILGGGQIAANRGINALERRAAIASAQAETGTQLQLMGDDVVAAIIEEGLASDPSTRSYQLAQQIQNKQAQGQPVTARELGELYQENVRTVAQEQAQQETAGEEAEGLSLPTLEETQEAVRRSEPAAVQRGTIQTETPEAPASPVQPLQRAAVQEPAPAPETAQGTQQAAVAGVDAAQPGVVSLDQQTLTERTAGQDGQQGEGLSSGGQGRLSGTGTGEQAGGLGEGAGQGRRASEQFRAASRRQDRVNALRQERVSSRELGIPQGTTARVIQTVPEAAWDEGMRSTADRVNRETGLGVTYVIGGIQVAAPDGARLVRGVYTGEGIIIQADNLRLTTDQIADHEIFHDKSFRTPGLVREIEARILERYDAEEFARVVETYTQKLRGVVDLPENAGAEAVDAAVRDILEEIFADAYAGINAFSAHAERYNPTVEQVLEERGIGRGRQNAAATDRTTGPPQERYSIGYDQDNRPFVTVEEDILAGVPEDQWVKTVKNNLREKFPNGITVGNNEIRINNQSRREMTFSGYMQRLMRTNRQLFADKLRATNNADEILRASRNWVNEALLHPRNDAIIDFARGEILLRVGNHDYTAQVIVGNRGGGNLLLYDIIDLEPAIIQERSRKTGADNITKLQERAGDRQSAPVSENSIPQNNAERNPRYSYGGRNANQADREALARAEEMERSGADAEQIRRETGWFRGIDGLWRFEIDDSTMEYDPTGDLQGARSRRWAMEDLEAAREDLFGNITEEQANMVRAYNRAEIAGDTAEQQRLYDELTSTEFGFMFETYVDALQRANATRNNPWGGTLADYINHPELFANYPQLRDVRLEFRPMPGNTRGEFDGDTVTLNETLLTEPEDVLVHEIQHAIQRAEGFARGASPEYWQARQQGENRIGTYDRRIQLLEERVEATLASVPEDVAEQFREYAALERTDPDAAMQLAQELSDGPYSAAFNNYFLDAWSLEDLRRSNYARGAFDLYENTAGEIEARDAASRRRWNRRVRRDVPPTGANDLTVFSDADDFSSAEADTDTLKERQMQVIQESNPAPDEYHTWIRSAEEIKTFQEAMQDPEWAEYDEYNPDYTRAMAEEALESGEIEVFSSYPIEAGGFVTPSRMEAESYAGDGQIFSRRVPLTDVAWIDPTQGQYAPAGRARYSVEDAATEDSQGQKLTPEQQEFFRDSQIRDEQGRLREVYHGTNDGEFTVFDWNETQRTDGGWFGRGFYFTFYKGEARMYGQRVVDAYLNIKNPFVFDEQMLSIDGVKPEGVNATSLAFMINFAEKFPELAEGRALEVVTGWDEEGYGITKEIPWSQLRTELERVLNDPSFQIEEISDAYGGDHYEWYIKTGPGRYDYANTRAGYGTREMAEKNRVDAAADLLFGSIYQYANFHMAHTYVEEMGTEFTEALKERGFDGVLQTRAGDEVVAFYPEQIKRTDNKTPTTNQDIRYSVDEDQDAAEALLAATDDGSGEYGLSQAALRQDTNLQRRIRRAQAMTQTETFRRWFAGSRIQNTAGGPLLVFHGAGGRFTAFDAGGRPVWFTPNAAYAGTYAAGTGRLERALPASQIYTGGTRLIPVYLHAENPADVGQVNTSFNEAAENLAERTGIPEAEWRAVWDEAGQPEQMWEVINTPAAAGLLRRNGYDGIMAREGDTRTYAVFEPGQVKSAVANRGTFDRENPDIRFSVDEETEQEYNALTQRGDVVLGDQDETYTEGNAPIRFTYAIVPAEALVVSNDEYGAVNPAYPAELQPRDRSRTASQLQIQEMSRGLNPRLLADSPTAQNGAPIIRGDGAVIGGNARTQAIIAAYNSGRAAEYERFVRERGRRYGLDTSSLPQRPVLVRVAREVQDWPRLAQELNAATTAAYSTTEQAMTDAARMGDILDLIVPNDEGTINNEANRAFINQFIQQVVPASDRGGMTTATGMLSQAGLERAQYAVFARAYGNPQLLARLSESLDNDAKNVTKALLDTAANAVAMRAAVEAGTVYDVPVVDGILGAVQIYTDAKSRNQTVQEYTDQASLLEQYPAFDVYLAQFIENNKRSGKQIRTMLNSLYDQVQEYGDPQQESIFGGETHDLRETLERAIARYEDATGRQIGRPDFGRDQGNREVAADGGEQGGLQPGSDAGDPGQGRQADAGDDEGGEPEGLSLPEVEPEPAAEPAPEPEIPPAPDYRERLREAIEQTGQEERPAGEPGDLYRDEEMTDEQYEYLNERWRESQERRQRQTIRREDFDTVDEYTAALEQRAAQEKAERMKNISKEDFTGTPALERLGVKVENSVGIYEFIPSLIESDRAAKSIRKEMRRAERRLNATAAERNFASGVAAGVYSQEDIPSTMNADKVMELADYYWAERAVSADLIRQQRTDINKALSEKMQELFKDSDAFKPSRSIVLNHRTPERNMLHIFGDERGAAINAAIFDPVAVNEAERIRFRNRMHDEVRAFKDSTGKVTRLTKEERAIVQQVIEGRAVGEIVAGMEMSSAIQNAAENIKNGADPTDAATEFSLDREQRRLAEKYSRWLETREILESGRVDNVKVENAVKKYTDLFNQFYEAINDFLVAHGYEPIGFIKGYAPHIQPENNQNLLNKSLQAMGINTDVTRLPSSIAGLTADYRPNKRWNPYFLQRTSDITQYDIATAFESYVDYMSDVLYHTDDIMRVRQAANYFRRTYAPDEIRENLSWAEELRYRNTDEKAAFLRDHDVISPTSAMTPGDISQAMDDYVDQLYEDITRTTKYSELVSYLDNYANILAGKQSMADRGWEYSSGRTVLNLGNKLVRAFGRAQVAGNLSSALNQTAQLPQIFAELGARNTAQAIADTVQMKLRRDAWWQKSDFLTGKRGVKFVVTTPGEMTLSALFWPAEFADSMVSTIAVRGRYLQEIREGKSEREAMKAADAWGKSVMGSRAKGSRPLAFEAKNPVAQMVNVFQVEAINTWEHLSQDLPRDFRAIERTRGKAAAAGALAGVIVKMLLAAFLLNRATEEMYGGTPAPFDILGLSANFIASGEGLTTNEWLRTVMDNGWERLTGERLFDTDPAALGGDFDWGAAAEDLSYNISNDIPYLRNVTGLLGLGDETLPLPDLYGAGEGIVDAIANDGLLSMETLAALGAAAAEFLPGGRQATKTVQGLATILRGGRYYGYGDGARLQYPVEGDFFDVVRALMFGNSALEETNEFYASGDSGLSAAQTQLYNDLVAAGADGMELYRGIQDYRAAAGDEALSSLEKGKQERDIIRALNLTDEQKLSLYHGLTGADSRAEKFQTLMDAGMTWDEVMDAYDRYAELDADEAMKATDKATELARWADERYPEEQAAAVKEQLAFFSIIPAQAERYAALTEAGLDVESAYNLTEIFAGLEPEEGADTVSNMQRYQAVVTSGLSDQEQLTALGTLMGESEYVKVETGYEFGVTPEQYIQARESVAEIDDNGSTSQDEATRAISSIQGLTVRERAVLWQLQNKSWKATNNPYDTITGQQVYNALHAGDTEETVELPRLGQAAEDADLPTLSLPRLG